MRPNDGNPVTGKNFYNRTEELRRLRSHVENKQHINIRSPRRTGKTSIMRELMRQMKLDGWAILEIDFAGCSSIQGFFQKLAAKLQEAIGSEQSGGQALLEKAKSFGSSIKEVKAGQFGVSLERKEETSFAQIDLELRTLLTALAEISVQKNLILGTDEIPVFLTRMLVAAEDNPEALKQTRSEISALLYWMRELRQNEELPVTFIHCGSIGIENIVSSLGLTHTLTGLTHQEIGPFSQEHSLGLIDALADYCELNIDPATKEHLLHRIEWRLPYFIQLLLFKINEPKDATRRHAEDYPTMRDVDNAYQQILEEGKIHFKHWHTRLSEQLTKRQSQICLLLLKQIAKSHQKGFERDQLINISLATSDKPPTEDDEQEIREMLSLLEHDGYLRRNSTDHYHFRTPLLRDYWLRDLC